MPIYEYACTACGERTEARQSFDDPPLQECSNCGGLLRKLYSPVGVVFKGSGFYSTDTRKGTDTRRGDDKAAKSATKTESTGKSESTGKGESGGRTESPGKKSDTSRSSAPSKEKSA